MAKKNQKLQWDDAEEIAFRLIDRHPQISPISVELSELEKMVMALPDFAGKKSPSEEVLEEIREIWDEERSEMEDELGPALDTHRGEDDDEELDEDGYRDDRLAEDSDEVALDLDDEDEDEDEFGDGFQEEEEK